MRKFISNLLLLSCVFIGFFPSNSYSQNKMKNFISCNFNITQKESLNKIITVDSTKLNSAISAAGKELIKASDFFLFGLGLNTIGGFALYKGIKDEAKPLKQIGVLCVTGGFISFLQSWDSIGKAGKILYKINNYALTNNLNIIISPNKVVSLSINF
jgi:hypothetical protein